MNPESNDFNNGQQNHQNIPPKPGNPWKVIAVVLAAVLLVMIAVLFFLLGRATSGGSTVSDPCQLGHQFSKATCTDASVCSRCGTIQTAALGHDFRDATCTNPKTCNTCGAVQGDPLGHDFNKATCTEPKTCKVCLYEEGESGSHNFADATCTKAKTCTICGVTEGKMLGHDWIPATYTAPKTCAFCGETTGNVKGYYPTLSGSWKSNQVSVAGTNTYPWIFDNKVENCKQFTLHYEIVDIDYGKVFGKFSLYYKKSNGKWEKIGSFEVPDQDEVVKTFTFDDPISFKELAVVAPYRSSFSFSSRLWFDEWYLEN